MKRPMIATQVAEKLLRDYWNKVLPVPIEDFCKQLQIKVISDPKMDPGGVIGQFHYVDDHPVIRYYSEEEHLRKRYIVAHCLGHFALGHGEQVEKVVNFSASTYQHKEMEANRFALALMIPKSFVDDLIEKKRITSIIELGKRFDVSPVAMQYRLKHLGWLS